MSASDKAVAACCGGNVQALQVLLQAGISVNYASSSTGSTLVHMAAYCGQVCGPLFLSSSYTLLMCGSADSSCPYFFPPATCCIVLDATWGQLEGGRQRRRHHSPLCLHEGDEGRTARSDTQVPAMLSCEHAQRCTKWPWGYTNHGGHQVSTPFMCTHDYHMTTV